VSWIFWVFDCCQLGIRSSFFLLVCATYVWWAMRQNNWKQVFDSGLRRLSDQTHFPRMCKSPIIHHESPSSTIKVMSIAISAFSTSSKFGRFWTCLMIIITKMVSGKACCLLSSLDYQVLLKISKDVTTQTLICIIVTLAWIPDTNDCSRLQESLVREYIKASWHASGRLTTNFSSVSEKQGQRPSSLFKDS